MTSSAAVAVTRLRVALSALSDALAAGRLDGVLDAELPLVNAIRALPSGPLHHLSVAERLHLRANIDDARALLARCRRLGSTAGDMISAMTMHSSYGRLGTFQSASSSAAMSARR